MSSFLTRLANFWLGLVLFQITLGAWTIWSNKAADIATAHVGVGALTFATAIVISASLLRLRQAESAHPSSLVRSELVEISAR